MAELAGHRAGALADPVAEFAHPAAPIARLQAGDADGAGGDTAPAEYTRADAGDTLGVLFVVDRVAAFQAEGQLLHKLRHRGDGARRTSRQFAALQDALRFVARHR